MLVEAVLDRLALRFFLERAGELRINILRKRKGGKEPPGQKKGPSFAFLNRDFDK